MRHTGRADYAVPDERLNDTFFDFVLCWENRAHGYYGQFLYDIPAEIRLRVLGFDGKPLPGATVKVYQFCERPGQGKVLTKQLKAQGVTDGSGEFALPDVPIDPSLAPPVLTGDELRANPFGYLAVVGTNGVLHFRVEYGGPPRTSRSASTPRTRTSSSSREAPGSG